jgi:hypothetical protein
VKPTYTLSGDMFIRLTKGEDLIRQFERLMNREATSGKGPFSTRATVSDKPCRSLDE